MNKLFIPNGISAKPITIEIDGSVDELQNIIKFKEIVPVVHSNRTKKKHYVSMEYLRETLQHFRGIDEHNIATAPQRIIESYNNVLRVQSNTHRIKHSDFSEGTNFLMPHQRMGRELAKTRKRFGFFYSVRAGKTPMLLQIIQDNPQDKWLIVCPLVLIDNAWIADAKKFFPEMSVVKLHATTRAKRMKEFAKDSKVYIINNESFVDYEKEIRELGINAVILDESSSLKSHSSKFSKAFSKYCLDMNKVYLLSGTPAPNGMHEYYNQIQCLDPQLVPQSFTQFEKDFFVNISYNPQFKDLAIRPDKEKVLKDIIEKVGIYIDATDYFEFPGRSFETVNIDMPDELAQQYKMMLKELYMEVDNKEDTTQITASSASAKFNKLRQISSGFIYNEDGAAVLLSMFKFNALIELLNTFGNEQVLIWANYKYEFEVIKQLLGDRCRIINGTVGIDEKNKAIAMFKSGQVQFLLANPASADKGLTLTNAHLCVYFSLNYSYELYHQSMARIYGGIHSQPKFCKYYMFEVNKTLDKQIYKTLENKQDVSLAILNHIRI